MKCTTGIAISFLLLVSTGSISAQDKFDWAIASQAMSLEYRSIVSLNEGKSVAWVEKSQVSYQTNEPKFKNSRNVTFGNRQLIENSNGNMIICFDSTASPIWVKTIYQDEGEIIGMVRGLNNEIICVVQAYGQEMYREWISERDVVKEKNRIQDVVIQPKPKTESIPNTKILPGINLVTLSSKGYVLKSTLVKHLSNIDEMDFDGCVFHPDGSIILHGFVEGNTVAGNLKPTKFSGGGDFILAVSQAGIPAWGDIVHSRSASCCSRTSEGSSVSVAPDGKVYFAGTYFNGGIFSNNVQTLAPRKYLERPNDVTEVFVVSYNSKGKMRWVKTAEAESRVHSIAANNSGITLGFYSRKRNVFGEKVDTKLDETYTTHLARLNTKGKTEWVKSLQFQSVHHIESLANGRQVCVGYYKLGFSEDKQLDKVKIPKRDDIIVFEIDAKSKIKKYWTAHLLLSREKVQLCKASEGENNFIIAFETWCALSLDLKKIDSSLPDVKCYGGTPIIGEIELRD